MPGRHYTSGPNSSAWPGLIEAYRHRLPVTASTPVVTLYEGGTPLVAAPKVAELVDAEVYLKVEGANPTGSFKDRGMTMAISRRPRPAPRPSSAPRPVTPRPPRRPTPSGPA